VKIWKIFTQGFGKVNQNKRMLLLLFGVQFVFALILLLPLRSELNDMLGYSLMGQEALEGRGANIFVEFLVHHAETISLERSLLFGIGFLYLFMTIFFNGGILGIFTKKDERFSARLFFESAGRFFGKFFRLFLFSLVFLLLALLLYSALLGLAKAIAGDAEVLKGVLNIILIIKLFFLILFINMVFDYAKIRTVVEDRKDMFRTGLRSWGFVFKNLGKTLGLYYLIFLQGILALVLYLVISHWIQGVTGLGILLLFIWQQIYTLTRIWIRLQVYASETVLYQNVSGS